MRRKIVCLVIAVVVFNLFGTTGVAGDGTVFGPRDLVISNLRLLFFNQMFPVTEPGNGLLMVRKKTSDKKIYGGFIYFNGTYVPLQAFLTGEEVLFQQEVTLRSRNHVTVFLAGTPRAAVCIEIRAASVIPPPEVHLSADPLTMTAGEASTLTWQVHHADVVSIDNGIGMVQSSGFTTVSPPETTTYTLAAEGPGGTETGNVTVTVMAANTMPVADAGPDQAAVRGDTIVLDGHRSYDPDGDILTYQWSVVSMPVESGATLFEPNSISPSFMSEAIGPYVFELVVYDGKSASAPDTVTITVAPLMVMVPDVSGLIQADAQNAITAAALGVGAIDSDHSNVVAEGYVISQNPASGLLVEEDSLVNLVVSLGPAPPTVRLWATPEVIETGASTTLSWEAARVDRGFIEPDLGNISPTGSTTVSPAHTTTYKIIVTGTMGSASAQVTVMVTGNPEPQPAGSFGGQYEDLIPNDSTVEVYDAERFSVITGAVEDLDGLPIPDVSITMLDHPEYGTTKTDETGRFCLPVEGGGDMTIGYQKAGLLTAQRKVHVPWNDTAVAETVILIAEDSAATAVTFDGNPQTIVTHRSSEVIDEYGTRSCGVVFTGDNQAYALDEHGNNVLPLTAITVHATEYATAESMPAVLPPNSGFTYCVELGVDHARRVRFQKPVVAWVDNFLGFAVGMAVPAGYYDPDQGAWVPSKNGVVVALLDTDSNGAADALDATGDGLPDDLDGDSAMDDEVAGLGDASRYAPGATFWRVPIAHFSSWDFNWPFTPPSDAASNTAQGPPSADNQKIEVAFCPVEQNSFTEARSRIFHEDIPIPGTGVPLHYASDRVEGYKRVITVPASGDTMPASLQRILVQVEVAGRVMEQVLDPLPNQVAEIAWDGLDHLGKPARGSRTAKVGVGYVYNAVYVAPGSYAQSFGQPGRNLTAIPTRREFIEWEQRELVVRDVDGVDSVAEGWGLSFHHQGDPMDRTTLYKGDGTIVKNDHIRIIHTIAGNSVNGEDRGYSGDRGPAVAAKLNYPRGAAVDAKGNLYIADSSNNVIRKVDRSGVITTVAGNGTMGSTGDGGPATAARLCLPRGIAVDREGNIYVGDDHRIRKVDTNGIITTVVGTGYAGYGGDGGPAKQAYLHTPVCVALDRIGNLYIADRGLGSYRVRKVDTAGIITTVMGNGAQTNNTVNGMKAATAGLNYPTGVAVDSRGNVYIADSGYRRVWKVEAKRGIVQTAAGDGLGDTYGNGGYGIPATQFHLRMPMGVWVDSNDNLYISENHYVHMVDTNGIIWPVAGTGVQGFSGDGGSPTEAKMGNYEPVYVTTDALGNVYIPDENIHRIRKIALPGTFVGAVAATDMCFAEENGLGHVANSAGVHLRTIDLDTGAALAEFSYNGDNRLVSVTDSLGADISIARNISGVPTAIVSPDGLATTLTIDSDNHLTRITFPDGSHYNFQYTPDGLMTAEIEPNGNRFEHVFDSFGRLTDVTDEEGGHWRHTRSAYDNGDIVTEIATGEGNLTSYLDNTDSSGAYTSSITDASGGGTLFTLSADGRVATKSLSCGLDLLFLYGIDPEYGFQFVKEMRESTPSGLKRVTLTTRAYVDTNADGTKDRVTEDITVNSKAMRVRNNTLQSQQSVTSPGGRVVTTQYDPATLLTTRLAIPGLYDTHYGYDTRGRLTSLTTNMRQTTFSYNANGFLESVIDPQNHTTTYVYDAVGRVMGITRPDTSTVGFTYDLNGNMTVLTNPSTVDHGFAYNKVNLNSGYQTPVSGSYSYLYDKDRRLVQTTFPSGEQINNVYGNGRLEQIQIPEGNIDLTYLCSTKVGTVTDGTDTITYGYDGPYVTSETMSGTLTQLVSYAYNAYFDLQSLTYAGGTMTFGYAGDWFLTKAGDYTITRNAGNGLPEAVTGNALNQTRSFNGYGELDGDSVAVSGSGVVSWGLTRNDNNRITTKTETVDGVTADYVYTYDAMGRLLTVTKEGALVEEYRYDQNGTRSYEMNSLRGFTGRSFTYSDEDHLLSAGTTTYQYDVDGFLTAKTEGGTNVTLYDYSSRGELLRVDLPDGTVIEYEHDPLGRRIAKRINGTVTEKYLWQGLTRLLAVYDGSNNLVMRFVYADGRMPVAMTHGGATYYLAFDQVGSLKAVADASGVVVSQLVYDTFGNTLTDSNPAFHIPLGFAGGLYDRDSGLVRFGYRDYDPDNGRWMAKDPIGFAGGDTDIYGYCISDPVGLVDPLGLFDDGLNASGKFWGHSDFSGNNRFNLIKEDYGWSSPFNPFSTWRHFRSVSDVEVDLAQAIVNRDKDTFERLMHQGQDFFSHYSKDFRWYPQWDHGWGHADVGTMPDRDFEAWLKAEEWTKKWLQIWDNPCP